MITELETMEDFNAAITNEKCSIVDFYATWLNIYIYILINL